MRHVGRINVLQMESKFIDVQLALPVSGDAGTEYAYDECHANYNSQYFRRPSIVSNAGGFQEECIFYGTNAYAIQTSGTFGALYAIFIVHR